MTNFIGLAAIGLLLLLLFGLTLNEHNEKPMAHPFKRPSPWAGCLTMFTWVCLLIILGSGVALLLALLQG